MHTNKQIYNNKYIQISNYKYIKIQKYKNLPGRERPRLSPTGLQPPRRQRRRASPGIFEYLNISIFPYFNIFKIFEYFQNIWIFSKYLNIWIFSKYWTICMFEWVVSMICPEFVYTWEVMTFILSIMSRMRLRMPSSWNRSCRFLKAFRNFWRSSWLDGVGFTFTFPLSM